MRSESRASLSEIAVRVERDIPWRSLSLSKFRHKGHTSHGPCVLTHLHKSNGLLPCHVPYNSPLSQVANDRLHFVSRNVNTVNGWHAFTYIIYNDRKAILFMNKSHFLQTTWESTKYLSYLFSWGWYLYFFI